MGHTGVYEEEVDDQHGHNGAHDEGGHEEGIPVREGSVGHEVEYEVLVDPCALPHEQVASVEEAVQADECEDAAGEQRRIYCQVKVKFHP